MVADRTSGDRLGNESLEGLQEHLAPLPTGTAGGDQPLSTNEPSLAGRDRARGARGLLPDSTFAAQGHRRPARPQPLDERGEDRLTVNPGLLSPVRPGWP
jgi:hypothetical protein